MELQNLNKKTVGSLTVEEFIILMRSNFGSDLFSYQEAADMLNIKISYLRVIIHRNALPTEKRSGSCQKYVTATTLRHLSRIVSDKSLDSK